MKVYAKSLLVGLCAAAVVIGVGWRVGLLKVVIHPAAASHGTQGASEDGFTVEASEDIGAVTVTREPWYVSAIAGLALMAASGWQLWRSRRAMGRNPSK